MFRIFNRVIWHNPYRSSSVGKRVGQTWVDFRAVRELPACKEQNDGYVDISYSCTIIATYVNSHLSVPRTHKLFIANVLRYLICCWSALIVIKTSWLRKGWLLIYFFWHGSLNISIKHCDIYSIFEQKKQTYTAIIQVVEVIEDFSW